jgi:hypothetical protein
MTRSPLGKQTRGWIGESRFRIRPRRQNVFLLPEGEGKDEGEGSALFSSRVRTFKRGKMGGDFPESIRALTP